MRFLGLILISLAAVFAPIQGVLGAAAALIVADLVLGLLAARKRKQKITSSGLRRTLGKLALYEVAIALAFLAEHYLTGGAIPLVKLVSGVVGLTEITSCLENINTLSGGSVFRSILARLAPPSNKDDPGT